jgi:hypothetical protein
MPLGAFSTRCPHCRLRNFHTVGCPADPNPPGGTMTETMPREHSWPREAKAEGATACRVCGVTDQQAWANRARFGQCKPAPLTAVEVASDLIPLAPEGEAA